MKEKAATSAHTDNCFVLAEIGMVAEIKDNGRRGVIVGIEEERILMQISNGIKHIYSPAELVIVDANIEVEP